MSNTGLHRTQVASWSENWRKCSRHQCKIIRICWLLAQMRWRWTKFGSTKRHSIRWTSKPTVFLCVFHMFWSHRCTFYHLHGDFGRLVEATTMLTRFILHIFRVQNATAYFRSNDRCTKTTNYAKENVEKTTKRTIQTIKLISKRQKKPVQYSKARKWKDFSLIFRPKLFRIIFILRRGGFSFHFFCAVFFFLFSGANGRHFFGPRTIAGLGK